MARLFGLLRLLAIISCATLVAGACGASTTTISSVQPGGAVESAAADAGTADAGSSEAASGFEFQATSDSLARAKSQVDATRSLRFEVFSEIESSLFDMGDREEPFITGEQVGDRSRVHMDMGTLMGALGALSGMNPDAMSMTIVTDGAQIYLNAPFFAEIMRMDPSLESQFAWAESLVDGWGLIDGGGFIDNADILGSVGMSGGTGPQEMLGLLESVGDVLDGGSGEVRGVPTRIAHAEVSLMDLVARSGQDLPVDQLGQGELDALNGLTANIEVHVDDQGLVRRLEYVLDMGSALGDIDPQAAGMELSIWQRVDYFDFDDDGIEVALPTGAIDITDDFKALIDLGS